MNNCFGYSCFPFIPNDVKYFGFSEFLAALALMVIAWTISDFRYKFRLKSSVFNFYKWSFCILAAVGFSTLITDLWRAAGWRFFGSGLINTAIWQGFLGLTFFFVFLSWSCIAIIFPSVFNRFNGLNFWYAIYNVILKGNSEECRIVADELNFSGGNLVKYAWTQEELSEEYYPASERKKKFIHFFNSAKFHAYRIMELISDKRFCEHIVQNSPGTAFLIFQDAADMKRISNPLGIFARNITCEAIKNKKSFIYYESSEYHNGYIGGVKTFTTILYGNYHLVEKLEQVYEFDYLEKDRWDAEQWEVNFRMVLMTLKDFIETGAVRGHSRVLYSFFASLEHSTYVHRMASINEVEFLEDEKYRIFSQTCKFLSSVIVLLNARTDEIYTVLKIPEGRIGTDIYDVVARAIFRIFVAAASVKKGRSMCWAIHYMDVWSTFFDNTISGSADKIIRLKVRRMIYTEIVGLSKRPSYIGANLLGLILNVVGLQPINAGVDKATRYFHRLILIWTSKNYYSLVQEYPDVAENCLVEGLTYEANDAQIVKLRASILGRPPSRTILQIIRPVV